MSASTIGTHPELSDAELEAGFRAELAEWFGGQEVDTWRHLRTYRIPFAQPNQVGGRVNQAGRGWGGSAVCCDLL